MSDLMELTKNEIIDLLDEVDAGISAVKNAEPTEVIPTHDFYRATMFGECIRCGHRWVDGEGCAVCQPGKDFLQKYREHYPWKSDHKRE